MGTDSEFMPLQGGDYFETVQIGLCLGGVVQIFHSEGSSLWSVGGDATLYGATGNGFLARTVQREHCFREVALLNRHTGALLLQPRFPGGQNDGADPELVIETEVQVVQLAPAEAPGDSVAGDFLGLVLSAIGWAFKWGWQLRVERGGWEAATTPFCNVGLGFADGEPLWFVETAPKAIGTRFWDDFAHSVNAQTSRVVTVPDPASMKRLAVLVWDAVSHWDVPVWDLALTFVHPLGASAEDEGAPSGSMPTQASDAVVAPPGIPPIVSPEERRRVDWENLPRRLATVLRELAPGAIFRIEMSPGHGMEGRTPFVAFTRDEDDDHVVAELLTANHGAPIPDLVHTGWVPAEHRLTHVLRKQLSEVRGLAVSALAEFRHYNNITGDQPDLCVRYVRGAKDVDSRLGLSRANGPHEWTDQEIDHILSHCPVDLSEELIAAVDTYRSQASNGIPPAETGGGKIGPGVFQMPFTIYQPHVEAVIAAIKAIDVLDHFRGAAYESGDPRFESGIDGASSPAHALRMLFSWIAYERWVPGIVEDACKSEKFWLAAYLISEAARPAELATAACAPRQEAHVPDELVMELLQPFATAIYALVEARGSGTWPLTPYQDARVREAVSTLIRKACDVLVPAARVPEVSHRAAQAALALGIDLRHETWHSQLKFDPKRHVFHYEHIQPVGAIRKLLLGATSAEDVSRVLERELRLAWITKEENQVLTDLGYASYRPDPDAAYTKAGIVLT